MGMYRPTYQADVTNSPKEAAVLQEFAQLLETTNSEVHILDEMQRVKFRKNFWWVIRDAQITVPVLHWGYLQECSARILHHPDPMWVSSFLPRSRHQSTSYAHLSRHHA
jgi:hypothetical protein